jgi:hydroxyacylglutathione hydrolase
MLLKQYYLSCLAHASYLIGDEQSGTAVIVDPQRDVDQYVEDAKANGLEIRDVFLTHFHADFLAGHLELRDRTGARIHLGAPAKAEYDFEPAADGDTLVFGRVRLEILETPGHSPESISIVMYDRARSEVSPYAVLTGDTMFIGDVGRPDLRVALGWTAETLAGLLYDSLHEKLLKLPDDTLVYPAHGAGSLCGKALSTETVSTMGVQRQYNYALQPMSRDDFIRLVTAEQPDAPAYFTYDAILNTKERPTLDKTLERVLKPISLEEVVAMRHHGAQIVDVRDSTEFCGGHLRGSINIGLGGQFATWAGTILAREQPIVIVASPGREPEAAVRLGRIGFDFVAGYLEHGMQAVEQRPDDITRIERLSATTMAEALASPAAPMVVDVRSLRERQQSSIEGTLHLPLNHLKERMSELPRDRRIVTHCAGGYRSAIAASLLEAAGFADVADLLGGIAAWEKSGLPIAGTSTRPAMKPTDYSERIVDVDGWTVCLTSYALGGKYYCKADNVDPGACLTRAVGDSKADAERAALAQAEKRLAQFARRS